MKFFRMFEDRKLNAAEELSSEGSSSGIDFSDDDASYDGDDAGDEFHDDSNDPLFPEDDPFKELGLDPNKYGLGKDAQKGAPEGDPQGSEEDDDAGQATDESAIVAQINALGAIHNEQPLKVESVEEVKNLIQMGKDYTVKTQALSNERKEFETQKSAVETELNAAIDEFNAKAAEFDQRLQELQQWHFTLDHLKTAAPDLLSEIQQAHEGVLKQFSNPILDKQLAAIREELAQTKKGLSERENKAVINEFEQEKAAFAATEQSMKELGVNVDWNEVKKEWAATGLPLKKVVGSLYFEALSKAQASKAKVNQTKAKVQARPTGAGGASRPGQKVPAINRTGSYMDQARALLKTMK